MFLYNWLTKRKSDKKSDIEAAFETPCKTGNLKWLKELVFVKKKNVNTYSDTGYTPLQYTLINEKHECTVFLLEQGANPNAYYRSDIAHYKTLWTFIMANNLSVIRLLTIYGADSKEVHFASRPEAERCFTATQKLYEQIKPLEDELKKLLKQSGEEQAITECTTPLAQLWQEVEEAENQNLVYKNHYKQKVSLYRHMAREPANFITEYLEDAISEAKRPLLTPSTP